MGNFFDHVFRIPISCSNIKKCLTGESCFRTSWFNQLMKDSLRSKCNVKKCKMYVVCPLKSYNPNEVQLEKNVSIFFTRISVVEGSLSETGYASRAVKHKFLLQGNTSIC